MNDVAEQMYQALRLVVAELTASAGNESWRDTVLADASNALAGYERAQENARGSERCWLCGERTSYNGWPNYETWSIGLVIDNDQTVYETVRRMVADRSPSEAADWLKDYMDRYMQEIDAAYHRGIGPELQARWATPTARQHKAFCDVLYGQVSGNALDSVDWYTLAEHYREK